MSNYNYYPNTKLFQRLYPESIVQGNMIVLPKTSYLQMLDRFYPPKKLIIAKEIVTYFPHIFNTKDFYETLVFIRYIGKIMEQKNITNLKENASIIYEELKAAMNKGEL